MTMTILGKGQYAFRKRKRKIEQKEKEKEKETNKKKKRRKTRAGETSYLFQSVSQSVEGKERLTKDAHAHQLTASLIDDRLCPLAGYH